MIETSKPVDKMKNYFAIITTIVFILGFSACKDEDTVDYGRLQFTITYNGVAVQNACASIATSQKNLDAGVIIREVFSDLDGVSSFGAINPGTYYYDSYKYINDNHTYLFNAGIIEVKSGHMMDIEVELKEKK